MANDSGLDYTFNYCRDAKMKKGVRLWRNTLCHS